MTLRQRLLAFSFAQLGAMALILLGLWVIRVRLVDPALESSLRRELATTTNAIALELDVPLAGHDRSLAAAATRHEAAAPSFRALLVRDARGALLYARGTPPHLPLFAGRPGEVREDERALTAWAPVELEGVRLGSVAVVLAKDRVRQLSRWMTFAGLATLALLAGAVAAALRFSATFVAPLRAMMAFSRRVAAGQLDERLDCPAPGELRALVEHLNAMAGALYARDVVLAERQRELGASLAQLRTAQEELLRSTRLAAVGEMAGRTAHEVLNPITGIRGRLTRMLELEERPVRTNLETLREIVGAWAAPLRAGGTAALVRELAAPAPCADGTGATLLDEDLHSLEALASYFAAHNTEARQDLQLLIREADRITHIVDGMRSLTRTSSTVRLTGLAAVVTECLQIMRDSAAKRAIRLEAELPCDANALCDPCELTQVLTNLIRNGMQAIEAQAGRGGGVVAVTLEVQGAAAHLRVRDGGTGVAAEHLPRLFEAGFTTRGAEDGTGLGLSIARRLVRSMSGELSLEHTRPGEGTTFLIELPVVDAPPTPAPPRSTHRAHEVSDAA